MHIRRLSRTQKHSVLISKPVQPRQLMSTYKVLTKFNNTAQYALYRLVCRISNYFIYFRTSLAQHQINLLSVDPSGRQQTTFFASEEASDKCASESWK